MFGNPSRDNQPWEDSGHEHNIVEHNETIVKCTECGKMATDESKLAKTPCTRSETDDTR